jgi:ribose transport system substrate-binding protein
MRSGINRRLAPVVVVVVAAAASAYGCGSTSESSSAGTSGASTAGASTTGAVGVDMAAAKELIQPFTGKPSPLPVDQPLPARLPSDTKIAFLQCGTPVCGIFADLYEPGAKAIGAPITSVKAAGNTPEALQGAMNTILETKPDGILLPGIEPGSISTQLTKATGQGIPLSADGIADAEKYGIGANTLGGPSQTLIGELLAGWVVTNKGDKANVALYVAPELSFTGPISTSFQAKMKELCASCTVRVVKVPAASIGTTAPNTVVSDLQSHPDSNVAVFVPQELETGLPAALRTAGLDITQVGFAPTPPNLADIQSGAVDAGLGLDLPVVAWTQLDAVARMILKAPLTDGEKSTIPVMQFLSADDLKGVDVAKGWSGYPDFVQRFSKFWNPGS